MFSCRNLLRLVRNLPPSVSESGFTKPPFVFPVLLHFIPVVLATLGAGLEERFLAALAAKSLALKPGIEPLLALFAVSNPCQ
jgi:hypothetical protein